MTQSRDTLASLKSWKMTVCVIISRFKRNKERMRNGYLNSISIEWNRVLVIVSSSYLFFNLYCDRFLGRRSDCRLLASSLTAERGFIWFESRSAILCDITSKHSQFSAVRDVISSSHSCFLRYFLYLFNAMLENRTALVAKSDIKYRIEIEKNRIESEEELGGILMALFVLLDERMEK